MQNMFSQLVDQLQPELEDPRVPGRSYRSEIAGAKISAYPRRACTSLARSAKLRVVPGIEALGAELDPAATIFAESKFFEQRQIPIIAAETAQRIEAEIPPGTGCRSSECARVEPLVNGLWI